ncbi:hypothetical protein I5P86_08945 [Pseudomonas glycinae]|uniref:hypothetical protein n=1 Tax=Pseudomonas TaxID=286 RepID=UPI0018D97665|nr:MULTISPECIES: hypothetical protein [Pseudomonas]MBH3405173.1 hypothetical protein [Pseudomonas glycinae]MDI3397037.1 hypothetical protein [Pseudomonas sp. V88_4]
MTSPTQPPVDDAISDVTAEHAETSDTKAKIPAFKFPFKPGDLAAAKAAKQPQFKGKDGDRHAKIPGVAPSGTRRSMGKR